MRAATLTRARQIMTTDLYGADPRGSVQRAASARRPMFGGSKPKQPGHFAFDGIPYQESASRRLQFMRGVDEQGNIWATSVLLRRDGTPGAPVHSPFIVSDASNSLKKILNDCNFRMGA